MEEAIAIYGAAEAVYAVGHKVYQGVGYALDGLEHRVEADKTYVRSQTGKSATAMVKRRRITPVYKSPGAPYPMTKSQAGYQRKSGYYGRYGGGDGRTKEDKFLDTALNWTFDVTAEVPATGGQLNLVPEGTNQDERVGRKITIHSIQIRGSVILDPAAGVIGTGIAYLYLVQDTQCNGAAAAVTDVVTSSNLNLGMINMANSSRFRILKRFVMNFASPSSGGSTTTLTEQAKAFEYYKKCNIPIEFSASTGAITEVRSNNVFLIAGSVKADDLIIFAGVARIRFSD